MRSREARGGGSGGASIALSGRLYQLGVTLFTGYQIVGMLGVSQNPVWQSLSKTDQACLKNMWDSYLRTNKSRSAELRQKLLWPNPQRLVRFGDRPKAAFASDVGDVAGRSFVLGSTGFEEQGYALQLKKYLQRVANFIWVDCTQFTSRRAQFLQTVMRKSLAEQTVDDSTGRLYQHITSKISGNHKGSSVHYFAGPANEGSLLLDTTDVTAVDGTTIFSKTASELASMSNSDILRLSETMQLRIASLLHVCTQVVYLTRINPGMPVYFQCVEGKDRSMTAAVITDLVYRVSCGERVSLADCMQRFHALRMRNGLNSELIAWPKLLLACMTVGQVRSLRVLKGVSIDEINLALFSGDSRVTTLFAQAFAQFVARIRNNYSRVAGAHVEEQVMPAATSSSAQTAMVAASTRHSVADRFQTGTTYGTLEQSFLPDPPTKICCCLGRLFRRRRRSRQNTVSTRWSLTGGSGD